MLGRIYLSTSANKHYSSKWSISATPDQCWTIKHGDYSRLSLLLVLFALFVHYLCYSLFAIRFSRLFAIRVFQAALNILCKQIHNNQNLPQSTTNLINFATWERETKSYLKLAYHILMPNVLFDTRSYASMLHFGDEDGILYMYEDAWEIQWSFDFPCVREKVRFSTEQVTEAPLSKFEHVLSKWRELDCLVGLASSALSERLFVPMWKEWKCSSWQIISWKKQARVKRKPISQLQIENVLSFWLRLDPTHNLLWAICWHQRNQKTLLLLILSKH